MESEKLIYEEEAVTKIRSLIELPAEFRVRAIAAVRQAKAVDAKPVKRGHWTPLRKNGFSFGVTCSKCNTTWDVASNFCPNCGALMDKEVKNERADA